MSNTNDTNNTEVCQELPDGFAPAEHDVVIGKGKRFYFHSGNQWLRTLVSSMLDEYKAAQTKSDKSNIISDVVEYVRQHGRFVKRDLKSGKWVYAEPLLCREKCSQTFRDNLSETYRSSNVAKRNKRRAEQQDKKRVPEAKRMRVDPAPVPVPVPVETMAPANNMSMNMNMNMNSVMPQLNELLNFHQQQQQQQQPQQQQPQQQQQAAPAPIPGNLFDLDMPLWSPKQRQNSLLPTNLDFSALTRGSITGTAGSFDNHANHNNNNNNGGLQLNMNGLNSVNLMQSLPDILNNLTQLVSNQNNQPHQQAPAPADNGLGYNTFHHSAPAPGTSSGLPPLTGTVDAAPGVASLPTFDLGALFEPRPMAEKRHSLALFSDFDWLKPSANNNNGNNGEDPHASISAAFAA